MTSDEASTISVGATVLRLTSSDGYNNDIESPRNRLSKHKPWNSTYSLLKQTSVRWIYVKHESETIDNVALRLEIKDLMAKLNKIVESDLSVIEQEILKEFKCDDPNFWK